MGQMGRKFPITLTRARPRDSPENLSHLPHLPHFALPTAIPKLLSIFRINTPASRSPSSATAALQIHAEHLMLRHVPFCYYVADFT